MIRRLESSGMSKDDAELVTEKTSNYENIFVDRVLCEELGVQIPDENDAVLLAESFVMLFAYNLVGAIPLIAYVCCLLLDVDEDLIYIWSTSGTLIALIFLSVIKSSYSCTFWLCSVTETLIVAGLCGSLAYALGYFLSDFLEE